MANEATLIFRKSDPIPRVIADTAFEKGTILKLTDNNTVEASAGSGDVFGGVLAREMLSGDGRTEAAAFMDGTFQMTAAASTITTGEWVSTSGANLIKTATEAEIAAGKGIGIAQEDFAASGTGFVRVGGY